MSDRPSVEFLSGGSRLHLQHGPIDLVIGADGDRAAAFAAAEVRLETVLIELMEEIDVLRMNDGPCPKGEIAQKMWHAVQAHLGFVTPMAAVAGAVAESILEAMRDATDLRRAYVNNGGDIAIYLSGDAEFKVAMASIDGSKHGKISLRAQDGIGGIATSGQGGRSLSLGIADSVSVLAKTASMADVAATLIANAVDLPEHPAIRRVLAQDIVEDSDLGHLPVVVQVGALKDADVARALAAGVSCAETMHAERLIQAASLHLRGQSRQIELNTRKVLEHA